MDEAPQDRIWIKESEASFCGPITALSFISRDFIIAGEGSFLKLYSAEKKSCITANRVFKRNRIHRFKEISRCETSVLMLALGGKTVRIFSIIMIRQSARVKFESDEKLFWTWIWDAVEIDNEYYLRTAEERQLALVTSQNCVICWNFSSNEENLLSSCTEQCILYSASLWGTTLDQLVVAVGTVFNEVLVWNPFHSLKRRDIVKSTNQMNSKEDVSKRLKGHEGVIFSVVFTSDGNRLLSVSDDRSIRHWDLITEECLQVLYGHKARVWDAQFLGQFIISIGEDAACIVWDMTSNMIKKFKGHQGKSIWSLATFGNPLMLATGGGDSSIRVWSLEMLMSPENFITEGIDIPCCREQNTDFPRNVCILSFKELLVLTNSGCLLTYKFGVTGEERGKWQLLFKDNDFARYSCIDVNKTKRMALIGNLHGTLRIIRIDDAKFEDFKVFDGKIATTFMMEGEPLDKNNGVFIAASGTCGSIKLWQVLEDKRGFDTKEIGSFLLPYCKQRWAIACKLIWANNKDSRKEHDYNLIVGDRKGHIHVFHDDHSTTTSATQHGPFQSLSVHGKSGVTNIIYHNQWIYSTGRDGFYQKFFLSDDGSLTMLERKRACKGMDWIGGLMFTQHDDVLIYGFYMQSHFAIWSTMRNDIIKKLHCGGGYRSWDFAMTSTRWSKRNELAFVYLKGQKIMFCDFIPNENQTILKEGLHGRELTCIYPFGQLETGGLVFATGSEDTRLNISVYNYEMNELKVIHRIQSHVGSIKSIAFVMDKCLSWQRSKAPVTKQMPKRRPLNYNSFGNFVDVNQPYLLFTCGSRTSLKCSCIIFDKHFDHISSFLVSEIGNREKKRRNNAKGNDLRFMSLQVISLDMYNNFQNSSQFYCIVVGCSDGYIRIYGFSSLTGEFCLIMASSFHKRCVQVVSHFHCNIQSRDHHFVLSGSTDGRIALWDITECIDQFLHTRCDEKYIARGKESMERKPLNLGEGDTYSAEDQFREGNYGGDGYDFDYGNVSESGDGCRDGGGFGNDKDDDNDDNDDYDDDDNDDNDDDDKDDGNGDNDDNDDNDDDNDDDDDDDNDYNDDIINYTGHGVRCGGVYDGGESECTQYGYSDSIRDGNNGDANAHNQVNDANAKRNCSFTIRKQAKGHKRFYNSIHLHASTPVCCHSHKPLHVFNAHQSGIHSISVIANRDSSCVLASGGDDNAIFTSKLLINKHLDRLICDVHWTDRIKFGHHSAITGVCLIRPNLLLTCSIDQRLKFWMKYDIEPKLSIDETSWNIVKTLFTDVADPSDMACFIQTDKMVAAVCGVGLEMQSMLLFFEDSPFVNIELVAKGRLEVGPL